MRAHFSKQGAREMEGSSTNLGRAFLCLKSGDCTLSGSALIWVVDELQYCMMAKGKKRSSEPKGRKITLKMAKLALKLTVDGKRRLDLSNMEITTFPKCILKLCDVDELDLSRNLLKKIPDSIAKFVNLCFLDLHSNQLDQVPEAIGRLHNLYSLNLCNNCLSTVGLPNEIGLLRKLRSLNLGMNVLESIPSSIAALKELRHLGLFNNHLTRVPECLDNLPYLETVNLKCNPIPLEDDKGIDPIQRVECMYLVRESCLCACCLQKVKDNRQRVNSRLSRGPTHRKSIFASLNTPNLVVQEDQAIWR